ncbi:helix-turn-helix domain-containing protein [Listeria booriae]|uniref:helix-turn-helix domain-containing protein n=1 Tax=Listeria booriae TaxID=1552123 RepID=UPI001624919E|nr:helix-turn-helix domain-containing protein [Listeria booriae]MBC2392010.1 hypothetical protein [Listeria booriae]
MRSNNTKIDKNMGQYKELMRGALGERYTQPEQVNKPLFVVTQLVSYDDVVEDIVYTPYVAVCGDIFEDGTLNKNTPNGLLTLMLALVSHVDKDGFAFPSVERLSEMTGLSKRTVIDYINVYSGKNVNGRVLFYKQTQRREKGLYDLNIYYVPNCVIRFDEVVESEESKLEKLQNDSGDQFVLPDVEVCGGSAEDKLTEPFVDLLNEEPSLTPYPAETDSEESSVQEEVPVSSVNGDIEVQELDLTKDIEKEADPVEEDSLFNLNETVVDPENTESTSIITLEKTVKSVTEDDTNSIDDTLDSWKEVHAEEVPTVDKPLFKRGNKTSLGKHKMTPEQLEAEYENAERILGL